MTFQERLDRVMQGGNLTIADLARWFDRPHPTVGFWVRGGKEPGGGPLDAAMIMARLATLEQMVRKHRGLPIPRLAPKDRIAYLIALKQKELKVCAPSP